MTDNSQKCEYCGTPLKVGAEFCDACGQQIRKPPAEPPVYQAPASPPTMLSPKIDIPTPPPVSPPATTYKPAPAYIPPPASTYTPPPAYVPPPAQPKRSKALPIILGAVGCLVIVCIFACRGPCLHHLEQSFTVARCLHACFLGAYAGAFSDGRSFAHQTSPGNQGSPTWGGPCPDPGSTRYADSNAYASPPRRRLDCFLTGRCSSPCLAG